MRPELAQAIDLLRRDTPEAVEEAIGLLQNTVYSFSMKVCGHPEDAEDTMQEVLYRSLSHLARIQEPQALAVWLYTVTRNRCWRMRRKSANAPKQHALARRADARRCGTGAAACGCGRGTGERSAPRRAAQPAAPGGAAHSCAAAHGSCASRHGGVDHREVARILNLQAGTVRVRLHRARLSVRKEMGRMLEGAARRERGAGQAQGQTNAEAASAPPSAAISS